MERAVRAARGTSETEELRARVPWKFVGWVAARILALAVMIGAASLVRDLAASEQFQVKSVQITGNALLATDEARSIAQVAGTNVFWVDRKAIEARLRALPAVKSATVVPVLPNSVEIRVTERQPTALWEAGGRAYLVDREGVVLKPADQAGQVPLPPALPKVAQVDVDHLEPGAKVDVRALDASQRLASLLPQAGVQPLAFEWSRDSGLEVPTENGWRVRFDGTRDTRAQVASLQAIREYLASTKKSAELIDVRFGDRPYFR